MVCGVIGLIAAMNMDVSVFTGTGRVNNLGLMSERQNYTIVAGLGVLAGLIMVIFGGKSGNSVNLPAQREYDVRDCPFCAEPIKRAAIKCKHCGSDVEAVNAPVEPALKFGWVARVICADAETLERVTASMTEAGLPVVEMRKVGGVAAGAYEKRAGAEQAATILEERFGFATTVMFRDKVSGDYS
jgi:hypothetical protein